MARAEAQGVDALFAPAARRGGAAAGASRRGQAGGGGGDAVGGLKAHGLGGGSSSSGGGGGGGRAVSVVSAKELSERYAANHRLEFGDRIANGFCDTAGGAVLVDRGRDEVLEVVISKARQKLQKASDPVTALMALGLLVSDVCGRSGTHAADLGDRAARRLQEKRGEDGKLLLGMLFSDQSKKKKCLGAAMSIHRALLFKVLADDLGTTECTAERDGAKLTAWNTVQLHTSTYVIDLMHDPGALYEAGSQKHQEYIRLLEPGFGSVQMSLSTQPELGGKVPRPCWHVEAADLTYGRNTKDRLGRGGFGEVFRGTWADATVAIKVVKDVDPSDYDVLDFVLEIALLSRLNHPNVMRFWRGCAMLSGGRRTLLMVTEYIEKGGLSALLHGHGGPRFRQDFTVPQILQLALGIARGVQYLHSCHVLHLDLKSPNVLIDAQWVPKLCDFGLAKISAQHGEDGLQTTLRGVSPIWAPPEMFDERADALTEKADVYSFGIVFFELACRQLPFQEVGQRQLPRAKFEGVLPQLPKSMPDDFAALVQACCAHRPSARPTMSAVLDRVLELAGARGVELGEVAMPPWGEEDASEQEALKQLEERRAQLLEQRKQLLAKVEKVREQRLSLQQAHLGAAAAAAAASAAATAASAEKSTSPQGSGSASPSARLLGDRVAAATPERSEGGGEACCAAQ